MQQMLDETRAQLAAATGPVSRETLKGLTAAAYDEWQSAPGGSDAFDLICRRVLAMLGRDVEGA